MVADLPAQPPPHGERRGPLPEAEWRLRIISYAFPIRIAVPTPILAHLLPHPETPCPAVDGIEARVLVGGGHLQFDYRIAGRIDLIAIPAAAPADRVDGLWQHTCCEAFIGRRQDPAYREFNFSPSGCWAAYDFRETRRRAADPQIETPLITTSCPVAGLHVSVRVDVRGFPAGPCELGLSVVIETLDGKFSYWALRHPAPRPDFHHRAAFALPLELTP